MAAPCILVLAVCIPTKQRPRQLDTLLAAVAQQRMPRHPQVRIEVHVVDNDAEGSAREVVERHAARYPHVLTYSLEPTAGVAQARNAAVACAAGADAVVMVDDDEVPSESWLDALVTVQQELDADAVGGPVVPRFDAPPPAWLRAGSFLQTPRTRPNTGTRVSELGAGNALVMRRLLDAFDGPFDDRFGHTGGEDSMLFRAAHRRGFRLVWADEAVVHESVPPQRLTLRWVLLRGFREGSIVMRRSRLLRERHVLLETARAVAVLGTGLITALAGGLRGNSVAAISGLRRTADAIGRLAALLGRYPEPYR